MSKKSTEILELDKVLEYLSAFAASKLGEKRCREAQIFDDITRIKNPSVKELERVKNRYIPTHEKIMNRLKEIKENDRYKTDKRK